MEDQKLVGDQDSNSGTAENNVDNLSKPEKDFKKDMLRYKDEVNSLREKLREKELVEEEQKGNLQDVIARLKDENRSIKAELSQSKVSYAEGKIEDSFKRIATQLGCKDPDTFYKLIDRTEIRGVELDDKFNANLEDVKDIVNRYSKQYEHLGFFGKKVNIVDKSPNNNPVEKPKKTKSLDEMSHEELMKIAEQNGLKRIQY
jgi:hypothetical protein